MLQIRNRLIIIIYNRALYLENTSSSSKKKPCMSDDYFWHYEHQCLGCKQLQDYIVVLTHDRVNNPSNRTRITSVDRPSSKKKEVRSLTTRPSTCSRQRQKMAGSHMHARALHVQNTRMSRRGAGKHRAMISLRNGGTRYHSPSTTSHTHTHTRRRLTIDARRVTDRFKASHSSYSSARTAWRGANHVTGA